MSASKSLMNSLRVGMRALALIFAVSSAISYVVSLAMGPLLFFSTSDGLAAAGQQIHQISVGVFMILDFPIPLATSLGIVFMGIWSVFLVSMIIAILDRSGFLNSARGALSKPISLAKTNFLYIMPLIASALVAATIIISQFQETAGVQTGSITFPTTNPYVILTELSFAPLQEEFAFRITSIGILVGVLLLIVYRGDRRVSGLKNKAKLILLAMFSPELAKSKMGYRNVRANGFPGGISIVEWILILLTATMFGLAHFLAGSGWEVGKISTAFLAGLVFGIVFVAYGAYASILMHWFFNYYFDVLSKADAVYGGVFHQISNLANISNFLGGEIILIVFLSFTAFRLGSYFASRASGHTASPDLVS
jgi:membrane protease YdiL (CAAX protease family)